MLRNLKYAFRGLTKSPGFCVVAVLTLILGIGANSAIFSVVDAVLLRALPYPHPDRLIAVWSKVPHDNSDHETQSFADFEDLRDQATTLQSFTAFTRAGGVWTGREEARETKGLAVTAGMFDVAGVPPLLGRGFTQEEANAGTRVIVLSYETWKGLFNRDPAIIGKDVGMSFRSYTVVGVMPARFRFPVEGEGCDYWMPLQALVTPELLKRDSHFLRLIGRMKPGVALRQCDSELNQIAARLAQQYPDTDSDRFESVTTLHEEVVGNVRPALLTILAAVFFVLLIACANVANLLLARATARRREIAIRTALGASRRQIIGQLLAEGLLLAAAGAAGGLLLASWVTDYLRNFGPQDVPRLGDITVNMPVVVFTCVTAVVSTLLFALIPAWQVTRPNLSPSLQDGSRGGSGHESHRLRALLVVSQVALSLLLLIGAGLLIRSFANLRATNPGFDPSHAVTIQLNLPRAKYPDTQQHRRFFEEILPKLAALPGIEAVGAANPLPFSGNDRGSTFSVAGEPLAPPGKRPAASHLIINTDYFRAMKIPVIRGRTFSPRDTKDSAPVIIVNDAFARQFIHGDPMGQRVKVGDYESDAPYREVVGLVGSVHHESLAIDPEPEFYIPQSQEPVRQMDVVFRTAADQLRGLQSAITRVVHEYRSGYFCPPAGNTGEPGGTNSGAAAFQHHVARNFCRSRHGLGRHWYLRCDRIQRGATNQGNWHPHGTRCASARHAGHDLAPEFAIGRNRFSHRIGRSPGSDAADG